QSLDISKVSRFNSSLDSKEVYLGIRPENMQLSSNGSGDISGRIIFRENFGAEVAHTIQVGNLEIIVMAPKIIEKDEVSININRKDVHLFDKETELNYKYLMEGK